MSILRADKHSEGPTSPEPGRHNYMNLVARLILGTLISGLCACAPPLEQGGYILSDDAALESAAATQYVQDLVEKYPNTILHVEARSDTDRTIYLGFDEGTHTTRDSVLRVDSEGVVYRNSDPTLLEDKWVVLK